MHKKLICILALLVVASISATGPITIDKLKQLDQEQFKNVNDEIENSYNLFAWDFGKSRLGRFLNGGLESAASRRIGEPVDPKDLIPLGRFYKDPNNKQTLVSKDFEEFKKDLGVLEKANRVLTTVKQRGERSLKNLVEVLAQEDAQVLRKNEISLPEDASKEEVQEKLLEKDQNDQYVVPDDIYNRSIKEGIFINFIYQQKLDLDNQQK